MNSNFQSQYYIGSAVDKDVRYRASSGGIGTAIIKHLLSQPEYGSFITFTFDRIKCCYIPRLIYNKEDIKICGSIYQDIDLIRFIREQIYNIHGGLIVTCLPCQVSAISSLLKQYNIPNFIISFACSGQTTVEGTYCYYRFLGIRKKDVQYMQYRGNGWPSGIQIELKNGEKIYHDNFSEPWNVIHSSQLFRPKRCFYCVQDTSYKSDLSLADPWLRKYKESDKIGNTMFLVNTKRGKDVIDTLVKDKKIKITKSSREDYCLAQKPNIEKKQRVIGHQNYLNLLIILNKNRIYHKLFSLSLITMKIHNKLIKRIIYHLYKKS